MDYKKDSKIAILGYGIEGQSAAEYFRKKGFTDITVCDQNENLNPKDLKTRLGTQYLDNLTEFDIIVRSPGIPLKTPEIQRAAAHKTITSVTKIFFQECPCQIIAVTGTKGKGTTCTLIHKMIKGSFLGGNIGNSPLDFLEELNGNSTVILELGHGQIEDLHIGPKIGIILGTTVDHQDYRDSVEAYRSAKHPLIASQKKGDIAIINADYEGNQPFFELGQSKKYKISTRHSTKGGFLEENQLFLKTGLFKKPLVQAEEISLLGPHNIENVLPASLAATLMGVSLPEIQKVIREFKGLPHRLELVAEKNGIKFINDSFATTPETGMAAIKSFNSPIILLAGGSEKNSDFTKWAEAVATNPNIKQVILIGDSCAKRMEQELQKLDFQHITHLPDYQAAFLELKTLVKPGDTVLMSPACASFDLFENYKERGKVFSKLANKF
ncbi:UDP-N-acetylmuramoyl-L-alanine--D-glutamate ligase [Patescibacteria group bacterium]|nr:UDP-N-acetylmuramoyl-L-alanine--D-glutamate ligase [Patescibacteria group bacterium]